jgi:hypothetical protein
MTSTPDLTGTTVRRQRTRRSSRAAAADRPAGRYTAAALGVLGIVGCLLLAAAVASWLRTRGWSGSVVAPTITIVFGDLLFVGAQGWRHVRRRGAYARAGLLAVAPRRCVDQRGERG